MTSSFPASALSTICTPLVTVISTGAESHSRLPQTELAPHSRLPQTEQTAALNGIPSQQHRQQGTDLAQPLRQRDFCTNNQPLNTQAACSSSSEASNHQTLTSGDRSAAHSARQRAVWVQRAMHLREWFAEYVARHSVEAGQSLGAPFGHLAGHLIIVGGGCAGLLRELGSGRWVWGV